MDENKLGNTVHQAQSTQLAKELSSSKDEVNEPRDNIRNHLGCRICL